MEEGAHVWFRSPKSEWGWLPGSVVKRETYVNSKGVEESALTLKDDYVDEQRGGTGTGGTTKSRAGKGFTGHIGGGISGYYANAEPFRTTVIMQDDSADHPDVKLRNMPSDHVVAGGESLLEYDEASNATDDLIGLTFLHEPAILHALRIRYDTDIIYTSTGPILLAINPFKSMEGVYGDRIMALYRRQGEVGLLGGAGAIHPPATTLASTPQSAKKAVRRERPSRFTLRSGTRLPPHAYQTADDAYRAMLRGIEHEKMSRGARASRSRRSSPGVLGGQNVEEEFDDVEKFANQSILVSGESGAGKTVTTKIVLNYLAMLSRKKQEQLNWEEKEQALSPRHSPKAGNGLPRSQSIAVVVSPPSSRRASPPGTKSRASIFGRPVPSTPAKSSSLISDAANAAAIAAASEKEPNKSIEEQVLQSNPILESFGNARTIRNDNSSRFGKYINIMFTAKGRLERASIDTYLLEKVRLLHQAGGERNFHVFYQFLASATDEEREDLFLGDQTLDDFYLTNQSSTYDRRDGVDDVDTHREMIDAMHTMNFGEDCTRDLMRLVVAVLFAGNMTFAVKRNDAGDEDAASLDETDASLAVAHLLGVSFDNLAASLTSRVIFVSGEVIHKGMDVDQARKANEALIKSIYGAAFDFIVEKINLSINGGSSPLASTPRPKRASSASMAGGSSRESGGAEVPRGGASIGVLDIFGFETFEVNNFEQLCINYTNETLQQQFNKYVFKLEQMEYEREGILWKFIHFPDNQDVLDLIDKPRSGILQILDEQCMVDWGTDEKFSRGLYTRCGQHERFAADSRQQVALKFGVEHYAGKVEYTTDNWLEKNKDQLPAASAELLESSDFELLGQLKKYVRTEGAKIKAKSVGKQFSHSLKVLRTRIDATVPHYVRCLKPNDELLADNFDPKNIVEQLRYCGVLEAVRVSRAGYPTRYLHDIFITRYYMICPNRHEDEGNLSPYDDKSTGTLTEEQKELKRLVSRIAANIWAADQQFYLRRKELEKRRLGDKQIQRRAAEVVASGDKERHALARPETLEEFLKLDFSSRCAVAGVQLGKTKVFLRREAFERIEAIRAGIFGPSVTIIAKVWRGFLCRRYYQQTLANVIFIQSIVRMALARMKTDVMMREFKEYLRMKEASKKISRCYRNSHARKHEGVALQNKKVAIVKIQGLLRGRIDRKRTAKIVGSVTRIQTVWRTKKERESYQNTRVAIVKMQSVARILGGLKIKKALLRERDATKIQSVARMQQARKRFLWKKSAATFIKRAYREHLYRVRPFYGTFVKRYYMLGDPGDFKRKPKSSKKKKLILARHRNAIINEKRQELKKLANKLTMEIWEPGMFESFPKPKVVKPEPELEPATPESTPKGTPQAVPATPSPGKKKKGRFSLFSSKKKKAQTHSPSQPETPTSSSNTPTSTGPKIRPPPEPVSTFTPIPKTKDEFMARDIESRYALVGMQLCHGTVFLRTATFERLEKMRNVKVGGSAAIIQAAARRKLAVEKISLMWASAVKIQSAVRMSREKKNLIPKRREFACSQIQSVWRMASTKKKVWSTYWSRQTSDLFEFIGDENWYMVEKMLHKNPLLVEEADQETGELPLHKIAEHSSAWTLLIEMILTLYPKAVVHRDFSGALPIHYAAQNDNITALEIIYESYKNGAKDVDAEGRLPIHVAAEYGSVEAVKYLTMRAPEGTNTAVIPETDAGGSLPLHLACSNYSSVGVVTALLRTTHNFSFASRTDEDGELPLHLLLRCGSKVDVVAVKTLLTCHLNAIATRDKNGDIPLHIALKSSCKPAVIDALLAHFPGSCVVMDGKGQSPLFLGIYHSAEDCTTFTLIKHAPELVTLVDDKTGKLPIQIAAENELSLFIVYQLLRRDMPIDLKEKVQVRLKPHHFSWNHIVLGVEDKYYQVVSKILQQCTQPQVLALAHVEDAQGKMALASATPISRHEIRVMLRLFNTLELVKQRPAFTNPSSETEVFYALRYDPPPEQSDQFTTEYVEKKDEVENYVEDWDDDLSQSSETSRHGVGREDNDANLSVKEKLKVIRAEKGQRVIAKITPRSDIVERELRVRKDFNLSRNYCPSVISVHHTVQHGAYANASADGGYCITIEGADATVEHQMLDLRRVGKAFPANELKRIGISLLHLHENGLIHTDFGPHNVGKFGPLWKLLGVGGSVMVGEPTDKKHGIYHPPESIVLETLRVADGTEKKTARINSIPAHTSHDIWAFGHMVYEAIAGVPLSAYSHRGKKVRSSNLARVARWDDKSLKRALRFIDADDTLAHKVLEKLMHPDPAMRPQSMRDVINDPFFDFDFGDRKIMKNK